MEKLWSSIAPDFESVFYTVLFVVASQAGLSLFTRLRILRRSSAGNEVTGIFFSALSLIYSLLLAFVIVAVWADYEDLEQTIENEADKLNSILSHSARLPDTIRHRVTKTLHAYCMQVIDKEWKMKHQHDTDQPSAIPELRLMLLRLKTSREPQLNVFNVLDNDLSAISDLRRSRLNHNRSHVPHLVWLILKIGSVSLVVFSYFFEVPSIWLKRIYIFFLSGSIAMCMFLVYTLDHPFTGNASVSTKPYEDVLAELKRYYVINK